MIQMHKLILGFLAFLAMTFVADSAAAQGGSWKYGFELGATRSTLAGELETNDAGEDLESLKFNGGFHLSFYARRHFTDEFGVQFGLSYAQRGVKREFEGPSYYIFNQSGSQAQIMRIDRFESLKIQSGYLDIPVLAFYKIGRKFEVGAGIYGALMLNAKANGELRISPREPSTAFDPFLVNVEFNYFKDDFGDDPIGIKLIDVNGNPFVEPIAMKAYHEYLVDPGESLYNKLDYGLVGQVGVYLNESLNFKGRLMYGLADLTKAEADAAKFDYDVGPTLFFRDDKDNSVSVQISLGFLF